MPRIVRLALFGTYCRYLVLLGALALHQEGSLCQIFSCTYYALISDFTFQIFNENLESQCEFAKII